MFVSDPLAEVFPVDPSELKLSSQSFITGPVRDVRFAPNGSLLLLSSSSDGCLKLWDCQDDGNLLKTLKPLHTVNQREEERNRGLEMGKGKKRGKIAAQRQ